MTPTLSLTLKNSYTLPVDRKSHHMLFLFVRSSVVQNMPTTQFCGAVSCSSDLAWCPIYVHELSLSTAKLPLLDRVCALKVPSSSSRGGPEILRTQRFLYPLLYVSAARKSARSLNARAPLHFWLMWCQYFIRSRMSALLRLKWPCLLLLKIYYFCSGVTPFCRQRLPSSENLCN